MRVAALGLLLFAGNGVWAGAGREPTYYQGVRGILRKHCTNCHSEKNLDDPDASGRLSLASPERLLPKSGVGPVKPGKADASAIYTRLITKDLEKRMPKDAEALSAEEIALLRRWIDQGAPLGAVDPGEPYHRRESGRPRRHRDLTISLGVSAPVGVFGKEGGLLKLVAPIAPLAPITALTFSPDGRFLACGSFRRIVIWSRETGTLAAIRTDPIGMVQSLVFSADGKTLWSAGGEPAVRGEIKAYRTADWTPTSTFSPSADVVTSVALTPDGGRLACVGYDRFLRLFELPSLKERWAVKAHSDAAYCVAFANGGKRLATAGKDKSVKLWDVETGRSDRTLNGHRDEVYTLLFSKDGETLFSSGLEPQLRKWALNDGGRVSVMGGHGVATYQMAWSGDFSRFITGGADRTARVWKPDGSADKTLAGAVEIVYAVALSPDGAAAAGGCADGTVRLWNVASGKLAATLYMAEPNADQTIDWLAVTPAGFVSASATFGAKAHWLIGALSAPFSATPSSMRQAEQIALAFRGRSSVAVPFAPPKRKPSPPAKKPAAGNHSILTKAKGQLGA